MQFDASGSRGYDYDELGLYTSYAMMAANLEATGYVVQRTGMISNVAPDETIQSPDMLSHSMSSIISVPLDSTHSTSFSQSHSQSKELNPLGHGALHASNRKESGISAVSSLSTDLDNRSFDQSDFQPELKRPESGVSVKFHTIYEADSGSFDGSLGFVDKKLPLGSSAASSTSQQTISAAKPGGPVPGKKSNIAERAGQLGSKLKANSTSQQTISAAQPGGTSLPPQMEKEESKQSTMLSPKLSAASVSQQTISAATPGGRSIDSAVKESVASRKSEAAANHALNPKLSAASVSQQSVSASLPDQSVLNSRSIDGAIEPASRVGSTDIWQQIDSTDQGDVATDASTISVDPTKQEKTIHAQLGSASISQQSISNAIPQTGGGRNDGLKRKNSSIRERAALLNLPGKK